MGDLVWGCYDARQMRDLMQEVGEHLTGRRVTVRARKSFMQSSRGTAHYLPDGSAAIDVNPDLDQAQAYRTFLHELAHIKLEFPARPSGRSLGWAPGSQAPDWGEVKSEAYRANEARMDDQRDRWDAWAEANLGRVIYPTGDRVLDKLQALLKMDVYRNGE